MRVLYVLGALISIAAVLLDQRGIAAERPNMVFILADDLGYTDLGCYGSEFYETPHIDRLAREGMRFTQGYTCGPNCQPTRAALMTGQYGPRTGVYTVGSEDRFDWQSRPLRPVPNVRDLPLDRVTVGQVMQQAGYVTGMFGKWHLGAGPGLLPGERGFDEAISSQGQHFGFETKPRVDHPEDEYLADFITDRAVEFIRRHRDEAFFLYLPHFVVHSPHVAKWEWIEKFEPKPAVGGHKSAVYAAMIASLDESVGRVLDVLDELKLTEKTLVIFSSDNGGVGGYERLGIEGNSITDNAPLRGGKGMLYEGGIRVPFIFRQPGTIKAGSECDVPINSVDLMPTLIELAGGKPPAQVLDGVSWVTLLKNPENAELAERPLYWHFPGYLGSGNDTWRTTPVSVVRQGDWKLMEFYEDGHVELYNLRDDIGETRNLAEEQPERAKQLQKQLATWRETIGAPAPEENRERRASKSRRARRAAEGD